MLLLKLTEHAYDHCYHSASPQFLWSCFLFSLRLGPIIFIPVDWLLLCCQIRNVHNLIIASSLNSYQVDLNQPVLCHTGSEAY